MLRCNDNFICSQFPVQSENPRPTEQSLDAVLRDIRPLPNSHTEVNTVLTAEVLKLVEHPALHINKSEGRGFDSR
jgi:hypothetical protein